VDVIRPNIESYKGSTENKIASIRKYKFSLVIENSGNYLSEKLFDALVSQTIVVYAGIDLDRIGLNKEIAIEVNQNVGSIRAEISRLARLSDDEQYKILRKQQTEFMKILSEWDNNFVFSKLAKNIYALSFD
jgi:hypothetical protein